MIVECTASALTIRSLPTTGGATDTGRRMVRAQRAAVYGESLDDAWLYVDAAAGRGWVAKRYTVETEELVPSPAWPKVPNGLAEIKRIFGEPGRAICEAGRVRFKESVPLSWQPETRITVFACHKLLEDVLQSAFDQLYERGLWHLVLDWGGCYNYRPSRLIQPEEEVIFMAPASGDEELRQLLAASKLSTHAWGIGFDMNTKQNPLGGVPKMDPRITAIMRDHGLTWGGTWARPDGMHYQYATGY